MQHRGADDRGGLVVDPEHDDAGVCAGRVGADVAEAAVQGENDAPFAADNARDLALE
jgi:hypothetical protein